MKKLSVVTLLAALSFAAACGQKEEPMAVETTVVKTVAAPAPAMKEDAAKMDASMATPAATAASMTTSGSSAGIVAATPVMSVKVEVPADMKDAAESAMTDMKMSAADAIQKQIDEISAKIISADTAEKKKLDDERKELQQKLDDMKGNAK
ncbi:hypothetical protein BH09SUM1_BH09SUM1_02420 [soil metagenome]